MISFASDYIAGAHPEVLQKLVETNLEVLPGYGGDHYCESAAAKIKEACGCENGDVYFLNGGTQTNQIVIDTMLKPYEGVVAADSGHIGVHEAGAVEFTGHKVLCIPGKDGKISGTDLKKYLETFFADENHEHMVFPGMVYISYPTEFGTLYTKSEMKELHHICQSFSIPLYVDGARLGYGLCSKACDMTLSEFASLCDAFYIGGTKVGALCGEAVVFPKGNGPKHFVTQIKQHGALLAKGRLLGVQFDALFTDDLYMRIGRHGIEMAEKLVQIFEEKGYEFYLKSPTNQQFFIIENKKLEELSKEVVYSFWEAYDENRSVVRFATSWSTTEEDLEILRGIL